MVLYLHKCKILMSNLKKLNFISSPYKVVVLYFLIIIVIAEAILFLNQNGFEIVFSGILVHGVLSVSIIWAGKYYPHLLFEHSDTPPAILTKSLLGFYTPFCFVVGGSVLLVMMLSQASLTFYKPQSDKFMMSVFLIPVVEEICYRVGVGSLLKAQVGRFWGGYYSILIFTYMHSLPSIKTIVGGHVHLFLGPLLLGIICELLYGWSKSILPSIFFHAGCNSTVFIFAWSNNNLLKYYNILFNNTKV